MSGLIVPCPHCKDNARLDPAQLPDGPVSYACPHCKEQVVVDKRQLLEQSGRASAIGAAPAAAAADAQANRRLPPLPGNATLPSGIVVGEDPSSIAEVQQALAAVGSEVEHVDSADTARELIINEQPALCVYVGRQIAAPPYAPMTPLAGLPPDHRRRLYLVLIGDTLKTFDGNAAFLYQVNMVLGRQDLPQIGAALHAGVDYHKRLYRPYFQAVERR